MCATTLKRYTADELLALPDGKSYELIDGNLVEMNMGAESSLIAGKLIALLFMFVKEELGYIFPDSLGYQCFTGEPEQVRKPDITFIRSDRLVPGRLPKGHIRFAPDLAVEVLSPNDLATEIDEKVEQFLAAGTRLFWIVNPALRTVRVHRADGHVSVLHAGDELTGGDVLPGFRCRVADLFAPLG